MTLLDSASAPAAEARLTPIKETLASIEACPGFIETTPAYTPVRSVFVCSGNQPSPLYFLDDGFRKHLPASFVATVTGVAVVERDYGSGLIPKLVLNCTIATEAFAIWMGANTWAAQTLLQGLALLSAEQLHQQLLFKAVQGKRTTFFNLSTTGVDGWDAVNVPDELFSRKLDEDEILLLAGAVNEQLD